jgi:hypothetical protein
MYLSDIGILGTVEWTSMKYSTDCRMEISEIWYDRNYRMDPSKIRYFRNCRMDLSEIWHSRN